jgi:hypothetical protein
MPVTLQPLTTGQLLDRTFQLYRKNFVLFWGIAALPHILNMLMQVLVASLQIQASAGGSASQVNNAILLIVASIGTIIVYVCTIGLSQAATTLAVSDVYLERPVTIGSAYQRTWKYFLRYFGIIIGVSLLVGIGIILLVIPGIYFAITYALSITVSAIENVGFSKATSRSKELVKGNRSRVAIVSLLGFILAYTVLFAIAIPASLLSAPLATTMPVVSVFINSLAQFLGSSLVAPITLIAFTLTYYDARVKKEAFDLHLLMEQQPPLAQSASAGTV